MDIATRVSLWLCILSVFLAAVSIVTVVLTLRQNNKMIEASTRPAISIYGEEIVVDQDAPAFYLVIKNYGQSTAYMTKFSSDFDFTGCYRIPSQKNYLQDMNNAIIAPGQSRICVLDYQRIDRDVLFDIEYKSEVGNRYEGRFCVDIRAGAAMPSPKMGTAGKELRSISYTLQEMLQKSL